MFPLPAFSRGGQAKKKRPARALPSFYYCVVPSTACASDEITSRKHSFRELSKIILPRGRLACAQSFKEAARTSGVTPPLPLKMVVRYAQQQPDVVLGAFRQDLQVIAPFQHRDQPALGGFLGQVQEEFPHGPVPFPTEVHMR